MKIDIEKITGNPILTRMAAEYVAYALQNRTKYEDLTPKEREIISPEMFKLIQFDSHRQLRELKEKHPDYIILMRIGDFYEGREDDARVMAKVLGITLSLRNSEPCAAFPHHALDTYLPKLIKAGHKVALCDPVENPQPVRRARITELVSPSPSV